MLSCFMLNSSVSILAPFFVVSGNGYNFTLASVQIHSNSINERKKNKHLVLETVRKRVTSGVFEKGPFLASNSILLYHLNNESSAHNGNTLQKRLYSLNML